ncbi:MAG: RagB/SusD family nutrient uptake outer membrane protein [Tannerellaceae bacterium]|jgi:hypothetical protein|nr:RagB/SusD family nutrient uptake outer membrane protein [Tannerellaceae bacterium]
MKIKILLTSILFTLIPAACADLDLNPLSEASNENWYSDQTEVEMALNDLYRSYAWFLEHNFETDRWTDDWAQRQYIYDYQVGAVSSEWDKSRTMWSYSYRAISRANRVLENIYKIEETVAEEVLNRLKAEALFFRACFYSRLITLYGDVPLSTETLTIEKAFAMGRTSKETVLEQIYRDFDFAIEYLPLESSTDVKRTTKGAALAFKARTALWQSDWLTVKEAAQACMDLKKYSLYPDYGEYFRSKKFEDETIFAIPRSISLGESWSTTNFIIRTAGGAGVAQPSWELLATYPCTDGLPIDESPLFNPRNPFENRDPRCAETIVEFGTAILDYIYDPHPDATRILQVSTGRMVTNKDTKSYTQHCSYNGLMLRKYVTQEWADLSNTDFPIVIMRYADVLLMYAEAKIELNDIDQSVLDAINMVRSRAYGIDISATSEYPSVTTKNQTELRKTLRTERRIEFAWEQRRFWDLQRWGLFEEALARPYYGLLPITDLKEKVSDAGLWFWPMTPEIDDNGFPNFDPMYDAGYIAKMIDRNFDPKQYLWPIPNSERLINENIKQNPHY